MLSSMNRRVSKLRRAFTLVELVVVVLIVGILAAVAAPKMFDTTGKAKESATKTSLSVVRNAIELHFAENGSYPATANDVETGLTRYIKGPFPKAEIAKTADSKVKVGTTPDGTTGWLYDNATGNIIVNDDNYKLW
jgi:general secretion pathway protein G